MDRDLGLGRPEDSSPERAAARAGLTLIELLVATLIAAVVLSVAGLFIRSAVSAERESRQRADLLFAIDRALDTLRADCRGAEPVMPIDGVWVAPSWSRDAEGWEFGPLVRLDGEIARIVTHRFEPAKERPRSERGAPRPETRRSSSAAPPLERPRSRYDWIRRVEVRRVGSAGLGEHHAPLSGQRLLEGIRWSVLECEADGASRAIAPEISPSPGDGVASESAIPSAGPVWSTRRLVRITPGPLGSLPGRSSGAAGGLGAAGAGDPGTLEPAPFDVGADVLVPITRRGVRWYGWVPLSSGEEVYVLRPFRGRASKPLGIRAGADPIVPLLAEAGGALLTWRADTRRAPVVLLDRRRVMVLEVERAGDENGGRDSVSGRAVIEFGRL